MRSDDTLSEALMTTLKMDIVSAGWALNLQSFHYKEVIAVSLLVQSLVLLGILKRALRSFSKLWSF